MIWRVGASAAALVPVASAIAAKTGATVATAVPVIWHFLGYPFEAASMVAALFGCLSARLWIGAGQAIRKLHRWSLDIPVSGMALAATAGVIASRRPEPLYALLAGAGLGVLGEGIFKLAERYIDKLTGGIVPDHPLPPPAHIDASDVAPLLNTAFPPAKPD